MCLATIAWQQHPDFPLVIWANRDEFHDRPTKITHWWQPNEEQGNLSGHILAGQDMQAGGTWLGISKTGRFALLTNVRDPHNIRKDARSRGELPTRFLTSSLSTQDFQQQLATDKSAYNGFNLLMFDGNSLGYASSEHVDQASLLPETYGLSNAVLNSPWPKTLWLQQQLRDQVSTSENTSPPSIDDSVGQLTQRGFAALVHNQQAEPHQLPQTGVPAKWEQLLSSPFIISPAYGTRSSYVILLDSRGQWHYSERSFNAAGECLDEQNFKTPLNDTSAPRTKP